MTAGAPGYVVDLPVEGKACTPFFEPDLRGFESAIMSPAEYALAQLAPIGVVTLLAAHGGAGKSILALTVTAHFAARRAWAGFEVLGGRAVFVSLEDPASLVIERLRRIASAYNLDAADVATNLVVLDGSDGDGALGREHGGYATREFRQTPRFERLRERAKGARLIVIDNASDAFDGNENERRMVREFMRMLAQLARDNDAAVMVLAHVDKQTAKYGGQGNSYSGSTQWHNSARSRLALVDATGRVELRQEKLNVGRALQEPVTLHWSAHGVLMPWADAGAATGCHDGDANAVLAALLAAHGAGQDVLANRMGSHTAQIMLATLGLPEDLRGARGRDRFWRAVDSLIAQGRAAVEPFRTENRKSRTRLVAVSGVGAPRATPPYPLESGALERASLSSAPQLSVAQSGAPCPHCLGEGCRYCMREAA